MDKRFINLLNTAFNAALSYRETKDNGNFKKNENPFLLMGRDAIRTMLNEYEDVLNSLDGKYWIAFSFAAATLK